MQPPGPRRRLILVRHAKSDYPLGVADHDRPLNARGRSDAPFIGSWLRKHAPLADDERARVLVSTALRAQMTWELARNGLDDAWCAADRRDEPLVYEAGVATILGLVRRLPDDVTTALIVGHNPTMLDVVWSAGRASETLERATAKFPTSSIAVLETDGTWARAGVGRTFDVVAFAVPRAPGR